MSLSCSSYSHLTSFLNSQTSKNQMKHQFFPIRFEHLKVDLSVIIIRLLKMWLWSDVTFFSPQVKAIDVTGQHSKPGGEPTGDEDVLHHD